MMGELPRLDRAQGDRQPSGFGEGPFVIAKYFRSREGLEQAAVATGAIRAIGARFEERGISLAHAQGALWRFGGSRRSSRGSGDALTQRAEIHRSQLTICCLHT